MANGRLFPKEYEYTLRERITNPQITKFEEPFLKRIAQKTFLHIHPDAVTAFAIVASVGAFLSYLNVHSNPLFYLAASLFIGMHYLFDGIDGKIAKLRGMDTPGHPLYRPYGWHIDKTADFVTALFFISGGFWAVTQNLQITVLHVLMFVGFYVALLRYSSKEKKDVVIGGTESRLVLIGVNIAAFAWVFL